MLDLRAEDILLSLSGPDLGLDSLGYIYYCFDTEQIVYHLPTESAHARLLFTGFLTSIVQHWNESHLVALNVRPGSSVRVTVRRPSPPVPRKGWETERCYSRV